MYYIALLCHVKLCSAISYTLPWSANRSQLKRMQKSLLMPSIENISIEKMKMIVIHKLFLKRFAILIIFKDEMEFRNRTHNATRSWLKSHEVKLGFFKRTRSLKIPVLYLKGNTDFKIVATITKLKDYVVKRCNLQLAATY